MVIYHGTLCTNHLKQIQGNQLDILGQHLNTAIETWKLKNDPLRGDTLWNDVQIC